MKRFAETLAGLAAIAILVAIIIVAVVVIYGAVLLGVRWW